MSMSRSEIQDLLARGELTIDPLEPEAIRVASIDLRLGSEILKYNQDNRKFDFQKEVLPIPEVIRIHEHGYTLVPGEWILASTLQRVSLPSFLEGILSGKSSWARVGLSIENAGYVDPGWDGNLTLEIKNQGPLWVTIYPGDYICQIRFSMIYNVDVRHSYGEIEGSHYQGSKGPVAGIFSDRKIGDPTLDEYGRSPS